MDNSGQAGIKSVPPNHIRIAARFGKRALVVGSAVLATALYAVSAEAASHREAPAITAMPKLDTTDFYVFRSYEPGREGFVTFIANYLPAQDPFSGPNYYELETKGIYEIHVDNDGDGVEDITFQFRFTNALQNLAVNAGGVITPIALIQDGQIGRGGNPKDNGALNVDESYTLSIIRGDRRNGERQAITDARTGSMHFAKPVDNVGFKTLPDYDAYAQAHIRSIHVPGCGDGRVFVGQRKDPFVVSLGETFDLINYAHPVGEQFANAGRDDNAGKNVTSLVLEVPTTCLTAKDPVIGAWTTASRTANDDEADESNNFVQVSRMGLALFNELVIGLKDKDKYNASEPKDDAQFLHYVTNPSFPELVGIVFGSAGVKAPTLFPRADLVATFLTGIKGLNQPANVKPAEMIRLNTSILPTPINKQNRLGVLGNDTAGYPNGRRPGDDVVDITLRVAMGRLISAGLFGSPAQAPSGALDFTDGAISNALFFDNQFPYVKAPIAGSPGPAQPSVPLPADPVPPGLNAVSVE
jgi:hypothetical protein